MVRLLVFALVALVLAFAVSAWTPQVMAGTADAPEITDPAGDHVILGAPLGQLGQFTSADVLAGWIAEDADNLLFNILITGAGTDGTLGPYAWQFHCTAGADELTAKGTSTADQPTPSEAATAASRDGSVITLTVPRSAINGATVLTGCHIESVGGTPAQVQDPAAWSDIAPDDGEDAGISYTVTGGSGSGSGSGAGGNATAGDSDGDGLNDTWETKYFSNITAQNGTGDPDKDTLNNTAEQAKGTNPAKADTDGDGLSDKDDAYPLDAHRPGSKDAGNTTDSDKDGLPDGWEREKFGSLNQTGSGDPDKDTLNNTAEHAGGTDPLKADTDGDGHSDADDAFPLDAARTEAESETYAKPELYSGAGMFAAAATFCLLGLARKP